MLKRLLFDLFDHNNNQIIDQNELSFFLEYLADLLYVDSFSQLILTYQHLQLNSSLTKKEFIDVQNDYFF